MLARLRFYILISVLTFLSQSGYSQITFGIPTFANLQPGEVVTVPAITYSGFDSVESIQFVVKWDSTVLRFEGTQNYNLPQLNTSNFGYMASQANLVRFAYTAPNVISGAGVSVAANTTLFSVKLKVIGAVNSGSPIQITEEIPTTYFEIITTGGKIYTIQNTGITNGFAPVGYTLSAPSPADQQVQIKVYPNPTTDFLLIDTPVAEATEAMIQLVGTDGKLLYSQKALLHESAPYKLNLSDLRKDDISFLLIQTGKWTACRPIVFKNE